MIITELSGKLKAMAQLLNISVDYLLDENDAACVAKNSDADSICALFRQKKMSRAEWIIDFITTNELPDRVGKKFVIGNHLELNIGYNIMYIRLRKVGDMVLVFI